MSSLRLQALRRFCTQASSETAPVTPRLVRSPQLPELASPSPTSKTVFRSIVPDLLSRIPTPRTTPIVLAGPRGVGKSTLLQQAVQDLRSKGYITLFIPYAERWTRGDGFFSPTPIEHDPAESKENPALRRILSGSPNVEGIRWYDRPEITLETLRLFLQTHAKDLANIPLADLETPDLGINNHLQDVSDARMLAERAVSYLEDLDSNWRLHPRMAGDALNLLMHALTTSKRKVALVIDNYDAMIGMTHMRNERNRRLHADTIRIVASYWGRNAILNTAQALSKRNGTVLLAVDDDARWEEWRPSRVLAVDDFPLSQETREDASGKRWFAGLKRVVEEENGLLQVTNWERGEIKALCSTFSSKKEHVSDRLILLAGGRADEMKRIFATR